MRVLLSVACMSLAVMSMFCNGQPENNNAETMWRGSLMVWCDDAVAKLLQPQFDAFSKKYPEAHIQVRIASGREVMEALLSRKARLALLARTYLRDEDSLMRVFNVAPHRKLHIATDALVFFATKNLGSDTLSVEALREFFSAGSPLSSRVKGLTRETSFVLPGALSSVVANVVIQCNDGRTISPSARLCYVGTADSVKQYVRMHANTIGVGLLSEMIKDTSEFKLLGIKYTDKDANRRSMLVEQSAVYREMYPFPVKIESYLLEDLRNLPLGVASFLAYETLPQQYFLKQGIVPAYARIQLIEE